MCFRNRRMISAVSSVLRTVFYLLKYSNVWGIVMMKRIFVFFLLVLLFMVGVSGCGSSKNDAAKKSGVPGTDAPKLKIVATIFSFGASVPGTPDFFAASFLELPQPETPTINNSTNRKKTKIRFIITIPHTFEYFSK